MTALARLDVALDAAVRHHFESHHQAGLCVPFEQIGARSRRIVRDQLRGTVVAVLGALDDPPPVDAEQWIASLGPPTRQHPLPHASDATKRPAEPANARYGATS